MYKIASQLRRGDTIMYEGKMYIITESYPHQKEPQNHILEFEDNGDDNVLLGIIIPSITEILVLAHRN